MRFTTFSTPINAYIFSAVALLSLIPVTVVNAESIHDLAFAFTNPSESGAPVYSGQSYPLAWKTIAGNINALPNTYVDIILKNADTTVESRTLQQVNIKDLKANVNVPYVLKDGSPYINYYFELYESNDNWYTVSEYFTMGF